MRLVLSSDIDPDVASALRAKMGMPHQFNPPLAWAAIGYLAAIRFGALIGFSDGRTIVWHRDGRVTRWELPALDRTIAQRIAEHGTVGDRPQARPRAFPIGGLRDGRMLWSLCWHRDDEPCYVADLVLLDVERQRVDVLRCDGKREMLGTEPKCVVEADAPDVCYVTGKIDVGAAAHIDDFIMVDTCWRVDLARGTYAREPETSLRVVPPEDRCSRAPSTARSPAMASAILVTWSSSAARAASSGPWARIASSSTTSRPACQATTAGSFKRWPTGPGYSSSTCAPSIAPPSTSPAEVAGYRDVEPRPRDVTVLVIGSTVPPSACAAAPPS